MKQLVVIRSDGRVSRISDPIWIKFCEQNKCDKLLFQYAIGRCCRIAYIGIQDAWKGKEHD